MLHWLEFQQKSLNRKMKNSEVRLIHFFDDEKFVNNAIEIFGYLNHPNSEYFVIKDDYKDNFIHAKPKLVKNIVLNQAGDYDSININKENLSGKKVVLLHNLTKRKQNIVNILSDDILLVWFSWGNDLYNAWKPFKFSIYEPETSEFVFRNYSLKSKLLNMLFFKCNLHSIFKTTSKIYNTPYYKAAQKIDISVPVLSSEVDYLHKINKRYIYAPFTYGNLSLFTTNLKNNDDVKGSSNILVGNSCTASNNHVEVFTKLSKLDLGNRKVIVPLSYGIEDDYLDFVLQKGKRLLGANFYPLTSFMPLQEYNKLLFSCNVAIFNHIRQQAVANIIVMIYFGARVFFNKKGMAYKFYHSEGLQISTLESINQELLDTQLIPLELETNRRLMEKMYSKEAVEVKVKQLYKTILNHPKVRE